MEGGGGGRAVKMGCKGMKIRAVRLRRWQLQERRLWRRREAELLHALAQECRRAEGERGRLREREDALHDMQHLQQAIALQHEKMRDAEAGLILRENAVGREEEGRVAWWVRRRAFHVWSASSLVIKGARELRSKVKKRRVTAVLMRAWLHWKQVASNMACFRRGFAAAQAAPSYVRSDGSPGSAAGRPSSFLVMHSWKVSSLLPKMIPPSGGSGVIVSTYVPRN